MLKLSDCINTAIASSVSMTIPKSHVISLSSNPVLVQNQPLLPVVSNSVLSGENSVSNPQNVVPVPPHSNTGTIHTGSTVESGALALQGQTIVTREVIREKIVEATGSNIILPQASNTLLGYDSNGRLITVGIGSGVEIIGGKIQAHPLVINTSEVFSAAPYTPPQTNTVVPPSNLLYPSTPLLQFQGIPGGGGSSSVTSVFGRNGIVTATAGDYTTDLVTEGSRLYFTDLRAQNALSGSILALNTAITTLSGAIGIASYS